MLQELSGSKHCFDSEVLLRTSLVKAEVMKMSTLLGFRVEVTEAMRDKCSHLSTGAVATIIDELTTVAIAVSNEKIKQSVSVHLTINYVRAVDVGALVEVEVEAVNRSEWLAVSRAKLISGGDIIAQGVHTKYCFTSK